MAQDIEKSNLTPASDGDLQALVTHINGLLDTLPERIADAMSDALDRQHKMIMRDAEAVLRQIGDK